MKKSLKRRRNEPIYKWIDRIVVRFGMTYEMDEVIREISKASFIEGTNATIDLARLEPDERAYVRRHAELIKISAENIMEMLEQ